MGVHPNIDYDRFPRQGQFVNRRVRVCFNYRPKYVYGVMIRDDAEEPFLGIIRLDDNRVIMATECQYSPL